MWITLTSEHLQNKLSKAEWGAVTTAQLPEGVTGPEVVAEEIEATVRMVAGYVAGNRENVAGPEGTVPGELQDAALQILRHKVFSRIPGLKKLLDDARVREFESAERLLRDVSAGRFRLVQPETPGVEQPGGQTVEVVGRKRPRQSTRESWSGTL